MHYHSRRSFSSFSQFAFASLLAASTCLLAYARAVDQSIPHDLMPATYKAFLLREVPGPRLIIDSGSNSHHAIDAAAISEALGITAINIADNAGYDLEAKIARLDALTQKGDAILLPLEWSYYTRERLTDDFVSTLFGSTKDYYQSLPKRQRIELALSIPPKDVLSQWMQNPEAEISSGEMSKAQRLYMSALQAPHGSFAFDTPRPLQPGVAEQTCDAYVFGDDIQNQAPELSDKFARALTQLKTMQKRGIEVMFTWPVVAGDGCLTSSPYIYAFQSSVEAAVKDAGFAFLGTSSNSQYPAPMRDDTPYHLITEGRALHTSRIIDYLQTSATLPKGQSLDIQSFATGRIDALERAALDHHALLPLELEEELFLGGEDGDQTIHMAAGWWPKDPYGYLMRSNRAVIGMSLPADAPLDAKIIIKGVGVGAEAYAMQATYKGALLAGSYFSQQHAFVLPTDGLPRGEPFWIYFDLPNAPEPQSPKQRGENLDERSMTLRLSNIMLSQNEPNTPLKAAPPISEPAPIPDTIQAPMTEPPDPTPLAAIKPAAQPVITAPVSVPRFEPAVAPMITPDTQGFQVNPGFVRSSPLPRNGIEGLLPVPSNQALSMADENIDRYVRFDEGWWPQEVAGRWMKQRDASLTLILPDSGDANAALRFYGDVFEGPSQPIEIFYDDKLIARTTLQSDLPMSIPLDYLPRNQEISLQLILPMAQEISPFELALADDKRVLTGFLSGIEVKF